jgi:hypothetical protein
MTIFVEYRSDPRVLTTQRGVMTVLAFEPGRSGPLPAAPFPAQAPRKEAQ